MKSRLIVTFALLLFFFCGREKKESFSGTARLKLGALPEESKMVAYINADAVLNSPFFTEGGDSSELSAWFGKMVQTLSNEVGLVDIREIYAALDLDQEGNPIPLLIGQGEMNDGKLADMVKGWEVRDYHGATLYGQKGDDAILARVGESTWVAGETNRALSWIDGHRDEEVSGALLARLDPVRYKNTFWIHIDAQSMLASMAEKGDSDWMRGLGGARSLQFSADLGRALVFDGQCIFEDEERAGLFRDAIKGALATAKLSVPDERRIIDVLNKININARGNRVDIDFSIKREDIDRLVSLKERGVVTL